MKMVPSKINKSTSEKFKKIKLILEEYKAENIVCLDLREVHNYLSFFFIATIKTDNQGKSIAKEISATFKEDRIQKRVPQSSQSSGWILEDLGEIAIHLMLDETRKFYNLERLWGDATPVDLN